MRTISRTSLAAAAFDAWLTECVILSRDGTILASNDAWRRFGEQNGALGRSGPGANYLRVTRAAVDNGDETAEVVLDSLEAVLSGNAPRARLDYPCHSPSEQRWFRLYAVPLPGEREVLVGHDDISDLVLRSQPACLELCSGAVVPTDTGLERVCRRTDNRIARAILTADAPGWWTS